MLTTAQETMVQRLRADKEYRLAFARNCLAIPEWKTLFNSLSSVAASNLFGDVMDEMSLEQLAYLAGRFAVQSGWTSLRTGVGSKPRPTTIHVWVIYWLFMESDPETPVYVGQTRQLSERWTAHRNGSTETASIKDRSQLRIKVVETVCGKERDALIAERRHILAARLLNPDLLNKA